MSDRLAREAMHVADVETEGHPGPFILSACVGHDGAVWALLTDAAGVVVGKTRPFGGRKDGDDESAG